MNYKKILTGKSASEQIQILEHIQRKPDLTLNELVRIKKHIITLKNQQVSPLPSDELPCTATVQEVPVPQSSHPSTLLLQFRMEVIGGELEKSQAFYHQLQNTNLALLTVEEKQLLEDSLRLFQAKKEAPQAILRKDYEELQMKYSELEEEIHHLHSTAKQEKPPCHLAERIFVQTYLENKASLLPEAVAHLEHHLTQEQCSRQGRAFEPNQKNLEAMVVKYPHILEPYQQEES